jgi:hypothetical protein
LSTLHQPRKLLSAIDTERIGLDFHSVVDSGWKIAIGRFQIKVSFLLGGLKQTEGQYVKALVANRKIGKDEITSFGGTVEIGHARSRNTSQNGWVTSSWSINSTARKWTGMLETGIEEEIGIIVKSDVLALFHTWSLDNPKLDNRGRINRSTVTVGYKWSARQASSKNERQDASAQSRPPFPCRSAYLLNQNRRLGHAQVAAEQSSDTRGCGSLL